MSNNSLIKLCAKIIKNSECMLITAGAGMGHDSGLPDFRGKEGLWKAYPYFAKAGMSFSDAANPAFFRENPSKFWFFYGHRYNSYRDTKPHQGFDILLDIAKSDQFKENYFVYTSNVDNQFQKAGFSDDKVAECHGSIFHFQCDYCQVIEERKNEQFDLDTEKFESKHLPKCTSCKRIMRPNILMFGDYEWISQRTDEQESRLAAWQRQNKDKAMVIIEVGAGTAVPTIRYTGERILETRIKQQTWLIRINTREQSTYTDIHSFNTSNCDHSQNIDKKLLIQLQMPAKQALQDIYDIYQSI